MAKNPPTRRARAGRAGRWLVLLAGGEGEEAEDDAGPEEAGHGGLSVAILKIRIPLIRDGAAYEWGSRVLRGRRELRL